MTNNTTRSYASLIQNLSALGILDINSRQLQYAGPDLIPDSGFSDCKDGAGELPPLTSSRRSKSALPRPHMQPSIFCKALASVIAPLITNATNLADEDMALFLATPTQGGIPGGEYVPNEITNSQVYTKADAVQRLDHPAFSLGGESYFSMLATFFHNVTSVNDNSSLDTTYKALLRATEAKNKAWESALLIYNNTIRHHIDSISFNEFLSNNINYNQACELEKQIQATYINLQGSNKEAILRQLDILKTSENRLSSTSGNMPCSTMSNDYIQYAKDNRGQIIPVDEKTIFYRPLYWLPNWGMHVNHWVNSRPTSYPYKINFSHLSDVTWESFGHKGLDNAAAPKLTKDQCDLLQQLEGTFTFFGTPVVVDIERGHWDVKGFRHGASLSKKAPQAVKRKFCKTSKFLLSWRFEIKLVLPERIGTISAKDISLAFLQIPAAISEDGRVLKFATEPTIYPWLIAALAISV